MNFYRLLTFTVLLFIFGCGSKTGLFKKVLSGHSGITFSNTITESDSINPIDVVNIYNGGGVGVGDFNNDGLQDVYFTGNMVPCKLYLNKGEFEFDDVTDKADVAGKGRWARGVAVIDINNDGLMDLYICNTISPDSLQRQNILYVNQGVGKDGVPRFKDMAAEYGLAIRVQSTMAYFFDYDNDEDLDMYLVVNEASTGNNTAVFRDRNSNTVHSAGRLYRANKAAGAAHNIYQDVSVQAGVTLAGFGHSATICDLNRDGWKDIYVSDDFLSSNILYINNGPSDSGEVTFTDRSKEYFKHTSFNSMGQDVTDINNDGLVDVFELDMSPEDNYRKKLMLNASNYNTFQNFSAYGYQFQYVRNTLQINAGPRLKEGDSIGAPAFSEVSFMSGVAQTDWSWTPLITDFNNDGYRDIIVTNGFPKDVSDHDFIAYRKQSTAMVSKRELLKKIPEIKLHNYAFQNKDGLNFSDVSDGWGLLEPTFSTGAAYADLDNDGDLDMIINNINDEALLYQNMARDGADTSSNYLAIRFAGGPTNRAGLGAMVSVYYNGNRQQFFENSPYRGYLSTNGGGAHFGLGTVTLVDSVVVSWGRKKQTVTDVKANQTLVLKEADAVATPVAPQTLLSAAGLFKEVTRMAGLNYQHQDYDFIDFNIQTTLPHKLSEYCPAAAAGDITGDGLDDLVVGGNAGYPAQAFLQRPDGTFSQQALVAGKDSSGIDYKDGGLLLLDVNGDGSLDVYATAAGFKYGSGSVNYTDHLYLNDGKGAFKRAPDALPANHASKLCVRAMDYNNDGRPDLFVSGRVDPWNYPRPVSSFIYRNDSQGGQVKFTDVTTEVAPDLKNIGMVCDALFSDFDGDNRPDLVLAGEWMPLVFLKNNGDRFTNVTAATGIAGQTGWWTTITAGDFRHTGRTDYIVGNAGLNSLYKATADRPVYITAKDFDNNGSIEALPSLFLPDRDGVLKEFPANGRDEIVEKLPLLKKRYLNYQSFGMATMDEILPPDMRKGAIRLQANNLQSCFVRNDGGGKLTLIPLPQMAQVSALAGMTTDDFDGDGHLDVLLTGNDYGTEVSVGRYDALNGLLLKGTGDGQFTPLSILQSGIYLPGNGKGLVKLLGASGQYLVAATQNRDALRLFQGTREQAGVRLQPTDRYAIIHLKNGAVRKEEFYYGSSFLSQSARFIRIDKNVASVEVFNAAGQRRMLPLPGK